MYKRTTIAGLAGLMSAALLTAGCNDVVSPERLSLERHGPSAPTFAAAATSIALDQVNGSLGASGTAILKGFNPTNPRLGSAIIATFFWLGSTNIITSVGDHLTDGTPVGNTYTFVDYVTIDGISMATYVATNVQNFPDPNPNQDQVLVVQANLSSSITDGGVMLSSYTGVHTVTAQALGAHSSASGSGSSPTTAAPGPIAVGAGALAYAVTMSNAVVGTDPPAGFASVTNLSDAAMKADGVYAVQATAGTVDPQWTWFFESESTWLATVLALNARPPAATHLVFTVQPSTTLPMFTIKPPVKVTAVDDQGNPVTTFTGSVKMAIGHNGGLLLPGKLCGTTTVAAVNGVATFSDLCIDQPGNGYTLSATASGLAGAESSPFNIGAL
jgi:hypothetical protein